MKKTVLITGADGLLGRKLLELLAQTWNVEALVHKLPLNLTQGVNYAAVDFSGDWCLEDLPLRVDAIIHLAQSAKFRDFPVSALDVFKVNVESTAKLLDYCRVVGAKKFVYASSGGIYGNGDQAFKENAPIVPLGQLGYYLGSKTCGEILVQSYASLFQVVVVRPFFMYGSTQNRTMLIPRLLDLVASGCPIGLQGNNGIRINPIHVNDASAAVVAALALNESATFNIAGPDVMSIREICEGMGEFLGKAPVFQALPGQPHDLIADISVMQKCLHNPKYRLLDVVSELVT